MRSRFSSYFSFVPPPPNIAESAPTKAATPILKPSVAAPTRRTLVFGPRKSPATTSAAHNAIIIKNTTTTDRCLLFTLKPLPQHLSKKYTPLKGGVNCVVTRYQVYNIAEKSIYARSVLQYSKSLPCPTQVKCAPRLNCERGNMRGRLECRHFGAECEF
jgi:hypothetical protein